MSDFEIHRWDQEPDDDVKANAADDEAADAEDDDDVQAHGSWGSAG